MAPAVEEQPAPPKPRKIEWTAPVRLYVQRVFDPANFVPGMESAEVQDKLKTIISYYAERDQLDDVDWDNFPLPQSLILEDRKKANAEQMGRPNGWTNNSTPIYYTSNGTTNSAAVPSPPESKKRKSMDEQEVQQAAETIPPWRRQANNALEDRISYPAKNGDKRRKKGDVLAGESIASKLSQADLERRRRRFQTGKTINDNSPPPDTGNSNGPIVGTCRDLEKNYFRLTSPPKPETVRPQHVLEKTLEFLKKKWRKENNYTYTCDQFKSLRQDLTVQHIRNSFTVSVYEIHARIALEKGDLGEYNQCQTQLRALYSQKLGGHPEEFLAYTILYYIYTRNHTGMNDLLAELTSIDKTRPAVKHALDVRSSLALGNYHKFFRLYLVAPNMGAYLMDMFIERERLAALSNLSRAYMNVDVRFITDELGFESDAETVTFLEDHGAHPFIQLLETGARVNIKDAKTHFDNLRAAAFSKVDIKGQI